MIIGVPREIKNGECRVAVAPGGVRSLKGAGHAVLVERNAGALAGFSDAEYRREGAQIVSSAKEVWLKAGLTVKVKEPQVSEYKYLKRGKTLFCYLHLAAAPRLTQALVKSGIAAIAAETVRDKQNRLPLLEPMSEIAGRMAALVGAYYLATPLGGRGVLVSGLPGVLPAHFCVIGGGTVGENAAKVAAGMGAQVTVLDKSADRLRVLDEILPENVSTLASTPSNIEETIACSDVIIGAVLVPGATAPKLVTRKSLKLAPKNSVLVDVCIDQGGISETSRPTSHDQPTYFDEGVLHYCVPNMPGAFGRTATLAFTYAMLPPVLKLASAGISRAFREDSGFAQGLNVCAGKVSSKAVADSLGLAYTPWDKILR